MSYATPYYAFLGIALVIVWVIYYFRLFKKTELYLPKTISTKKQFSKMFAFLIGFIGLSLITYSLMRPRVVKGKGNQEIEVNDIYFVVDVSRSMTAEDFMPNRLEAAKEKIIEFVSLMPTDRIGLVVFSERVFTLLPLTTDLDVVKRVVSEISIGPLGSGTNIGDGLGLAVARGMLSSAKNKVIVLLTDGVNNRGTLTPIQAAEKAKENDIKVYTIAMGSDKDAKIPVGQTIFGKRYQTIPGGSVDTKTLKEISDLTNASTYLAKDNESLREILKEISDLEKTKIKKSGQIIYQELYHYYLLIGVSLFMISEFIRKVMFLEII